ncbi:hypothetical protein PsB1_1007 [Candidatus Phycosocius spiralis]|uniref:ABC-type transport auxiliary lipoprotein component domain-containing protein n=1 Tax=Candidatus Phycosocius spiralis TaxID=2815099 RepID=A0ABQ4PV49_9PROT|nr:hypothetical protein PsB1_1007 [Candidatus Phycosocius spiralis]
MALVVTLAVAGCATPAAQLPPTLDTLQAFRTATFPSMSLGTFELAPGLPPGMDRGLMVRAESLRPPNGLSFAQFLKDTMEVEMTAAGRFDPASSVVISGQLTVSEVTTMSTPNGALGARFRVHRNGVEVFNKELVVRDSWEFQFIGAIAIPEAQARYTALYSKLVRSLVNDADFRLAVSP